MDDQQFHPYQLNEQSSRTSTDGKQKKTTTNDIGIADLVLDRYKNVAELKWLMGSQCNPPTFDNGISNGYAYKQR